MNQVEVIISGVSSRAESLRDKIAFAQIRRGDVIVKSALTGEAELNDHLVLLWNMLSTEKKYLKSLQHEGAQLSCHCRISKGTTVIKSNAAEMLYLLNMELVLHTK